MVVACLAAAQAAQAAAPRLKVVGDELVDGRTGFAFVPRGVNWPSFEYACHNGYGYANSANASTVGPDAAGAAVIKSWQVNTVRLPLNQDCWLGEDGLPRFGRASGYRAAVRRWVATLHRAGMVVILDLHWSGPAGVIADGQRAMADERSDDFWRSVARVFKKDRAMIFDVFNEPYERYGTTGLVFDLTWNCWRGGGCNAPRPHLFQPLDGTTFATIGMQAMVEAIRSTGARQPIMLTGRHYGNDLNGWVGDQIADKALIASFHNYNFQPCKTTACWDATIAPLAARMPVVAGEFGQTDCRTTHINRFMRWADRRGVGYLAWAWWLRPRTNCTMLALLADARGKPRKPNGTALKRHLATLAPRFALGGPATQALDAAVEVSVRCEARCRVGATGTLRAGRAFRLEAATLDLPGRRARTVALRVPPAAAEAAATALDEGRPATARVTVVASNGSHERRKTRAIRLR